MSETKYGRYRQVSTDDGFLLATIGEREDGRMLEIDIRAIGGGGTVAHFFIRPESAIRLCSALFDMVGFDGPIATQWNIAWPKEKAEGVGDGEAPEDPSDD